MKTSQTKKICLLAVVPTIIIIIFMILKYWLVNKLKTPNVPITAGVVEKQNKKESPNNGTSGIIPNNEVETSGLILIERINTKSPETSNIGTYEKTPNDEVEKSGVILIEGINKKTPKTSKIRTSGQTPNNEVKKFETILIEGINKKTTKKSNIGESGVIAIKRINKPRTSQTDTSETKKQFKK